MPPQPMNLVGDRYFRLLVVEPLSRKGRRTLWRCLCDCGRMATVSARCLRTGDTKSCGCWHRENTKHRAVAVHGHARRSRLTAEYHAWRNMIRRCTEASNPAYVNYGARGITVCESWISNFCTFLADVGQRPSPEYSIDRIDNDRGYEPGNVRWATRTTQNRNSRRAKLTMESAQTIRARLDAGESMHRIAAEIGVCISAVHRIKQGKTWALRKEER